MATPTSVSRINREGTLSQRNPVQRMGPFWLAASWPPQGKGPTQFSVPSLRQELRDRESELGLPLPPEVVGEYPALGLVTSYRWHGAELSNEARRATISLWSSCRDGWYEQVDITAQQLLTLLDKDRLLAATERASAAGIPLEHVGRGPLIRQPFRVSYEGSEWIVHPLNGWTQAIPFEAHMNKLILERAGVRFDTWHIADELPKPSLGERIGTGAVVAVGVVTLIVAGVATVLGAALSSLASLDPALVGTMESYAEPGQADWFIIARWYH